MIHIEGLCKRFGERALLENVNWHVKKRDRIGLTGPNGSGKTTLLRLLAGIESPDSGVIRMASNATLGYLPQDGIVHQGRTVYDESILAFGALLKLRGEQRAIEDALSASDLDPESQGRLLERYSDVSERFADLGGWEIDARVSEVLRGIGFGAGDLTRRTEEFSGGWQMRIALAKLLLARPNVLLLDEPTNHLDLPARNWLEEYLATYPGAVVLVSHDRFFLDATVSRITEVGLRTLTDYHGDYSHYFDEHSARMQRLMDQYRRQKDELDRANAFISRFRYQATKARQVQSRIKMLEKVELIEIPPERKRIRFKFPEARRPGRIVFEAADIVKSYGDNVVLDGASLIVERGDRVGLVGPNGSGKSTLMRIIAGVDPADSGRRVVGHGVSFEYFAQNQAETLNSSNSVYEEMSSASPLTMVPAIRDILGGFLFSGDDVFKKVSVLSGGERNRLAIAKMLLQPSNLLLLDEPTNHLDLDSKEILLEALLDYHGTMVFVSHDRYFIDRLATKVLEVGAGLAQLYPGGYEDFLRWKKDGAASRIPPSTPDTETSGIERSVWQSKVPSVTAFKATESPSAPTTPSKPTPVLSPERDPMAPRLRPKNARPDRHVRKRELKTIKTRLNVVESLISERETALRSLEQLMSADDFYTDDNRTNKSITEHAALSDQITELLSEWEALSKAIEAAELH